MIWHRERLKVGTLRPRRRSTSMYLRVYSTSPPPYCGQSSRNRSLPPAQQQFYRLTVLADVVHHPVQTAFRILSHMLRLFRLGSPGKRRLSLHEASHKRCGVRFYNRSKQGLLTGKNSRKRPQWSPRHFSRSDARTRSEIPCQETPLERPAVFFPMSRWNSPL